MAVQGTIYQVSHHLVAGACPRRWLQSDRPLWLEAHGWRHEHRLGLVLPAKADVAGRSAKASFQLLTRMDPRPSVRRWLNVIWPMQQRDGAIFFRRGVEDGCIVDLREMQGVNTVRLRVGQVFVEARIVERARYYLRIIAPAVLRNAGVELCVFDAAALLSAQAQYGQLSVLTHEEALELAARATQCASESLEVTSSQVIRAMRPHLVLQGVPRDELNRCAQLTIHARGGQCVRLDRIGLIPRGPEVNLRPGGHDDGPFLDLLRWDPRSGSCEPYFGTAFRIVNEGLPAQIAAGMHIQLD